MVKVGIINADTPIAGEIIRLLSLHPETELNLLYSPDLMGRNVSSVHHGLIGESALNFTDKVNLEDIDFLIILNKSQLSDTIISHQSNHESLKIAFIGKSLYNLSDKDTLDEIGISEINRKALVRGAKKAYIPSPAIVPALIGLIPLANYLLLNSELEISVSLPEDLNKTIDIEADTKEIIDQIQKRQSSFKEKVKLRIVESDSDRGALTIIRFKNNLPISEIEKIYDETYDDHNFTFISRGDVELKEVEGTHKTLIYLEKPEPDILKIKVITDARMRGGAGDFVHVMNLFFGLHEKTGLHLKASRY